MCTSKRGKIFFVGCDCFFHLMKSKNSSTFFHSTFVNYLQKLYNGNRWGLVWSAGESSSIWGNWNLLPTDSGNFPLLVQSCRLSNPQCRVFPQQQNCKSFTRAFCASHGSHGTVQLFNSLQLCCFLKRCQRFCWYFTHKLDSPRARNEPCTWQYERRRKMGDFQCSTDRWEKYFFLVDRGDIQKEDCW